MLANRLLTITFNLSEESHSTMKGFFHRNFRQSNWVRKIFHILLYFVGLLGEAIGLISFGESPTKSIRIIVILESFSIFERIFNDTSN